MLLIPRIEREINFMLYWCVVNTVVVWSAKYVNEGYTREESSELENSNSVVVDVGIKSWFDDDVLVNWICKP